MPATRPKPNTQAVVPQAANAQAPEPVDPSIAGTDKPRDGAAPPKPVKTDGAPSESEEESRVIYLKPLGEAWPTATSEKIVDALRLYFPAPVVILEASPLPQKAYYAPRSRYRAEKLLDYLVKLTPRNAQVIVGLTASDISTTKGSYADWGILGLATLSGRECVISEFRARREAKSQAHVLDRLMKTVVHEVGHTIGLDHCPNYGCIMEDGKGSVLTTDHELDICADCRKKAGGRLLPPPSRFPWAPPG